MTPCKILMTGASSFTGYAFAQALEAAGCDVTATFTRPGVDAYDNALRRERIARLQEHCRAVFGCRFGDDAFQELIRDVAPDVLCHHAADVSNYKSTDFDFNRALANNTHRIRETSRSLVDVGCQRVVLTGTVFEGGEGAGSDGLPHFGAYGLSKSMTSAVFEHFCGEYQIALGKFVVPNPFGPFEEPRFTAYLVRAWRTGETPCVQTPEYVRDNIHVSLLASAYARFTNASPNRAGLIRANPSGYIESQGAFAQRFAREMSDRLQLDCPVELATQTDFAEPRVRINTDPVDGAAFGWSESSAWDSIAEYYDALAPVTP